MSIQARSLSHRRRIGASAWSPASPTSGGYSPAHWYRSTGPLWQDAGITPAVADGDPIGRWEDLTENADHINQPTAAAKPSLQNGPADLLNGQPIITLDGGDWMTGPFTTGGSLNQPYTAFYVAMLDPALVSDSSWHILVDGDDVTNTGRFGKNASNTWYIQNGATSLSAGATDADWHIWTILANGASSQFWKDGASIALGDADTDIIDGLTLGGRYDGGAARWTGALVEIIHYEANLTAAGKNQVAQYLALRYGITYTDI